MDIIGAIGYSGQDIVMLGQDTFGYITGKSICIVGIASGPKEMIWRPEAGIGRIASHLLSHRLVIAPEIAKFDIEVIDFLGIHTAAALRNPSAAKIIDISFSRDGEQVFAISSSLDPKVFAWDLNTRQVIFVSDLPVNFLNIAVCPADKMKFTLSGDEGLYLGSIVEIMGISAVKYEKVVIDAAGIMDRGNEHPSSGSITSPAAPTTSVTFAVWAPFNRIFIGTKGGIIGEVNATDLSFRIRAEMPKITMQNNFQLSACIPLCATLSSTNLVVGTSSGSVLWFPVVDVDNSFPPEDSESNSGTLFQPVQNTQFESAVRCLSTDFLYVTVLAGTSLGAIMKFPLDIAEVKRDDGDDDAAEHADLDQSVRPDDDINQTITGTKICVSQAGAVLCCKSISLPVLSINETTPKTSVVYCSMFITGSHSGMLTFWKQPSVDSEAIVKDATGIPGIHRSTPRTVKMIASMSVNPTDLSCGSPVHIRVPVKSSAVASLEYLPFNQKNGFGLIMVGTVDGSFESWKFCAYEADEDEEIVHADEEDATVKLKFDKYFSKPIFHTTLSVITCSAEEKKIFYVLLGSIFDQRVFILKVPSDFSSGVSLRYAVNLTTFPASCSWTGRTFWIGCQTGQLCSFTPSRGQKEENDECHPHACWETSMSSITNMCAANKGEHLLIASATNDTLRVFSVQAESISTTVSSVIGEELVKFRNPYKDTTSHTDMIVCMAASPSGAFVAAGCVNGSVHIWCNYNGEFKLAARANLHKQPVLSISFSVDSSAVMTCGADGSVFLSTVNVPSRIYYKAAVGDSKYYEKISGGEEAFLRADSVALNDGVPMTWFDSKRLEALEELKKKTAGKVGEVSSMVEDIAARLRSIIDTNNERVEDIERLDRAELVVDLDGRGRSIEENEAVLKSTRDTYSKRNLWNEIIAARVRESCWDCSEAHERQILPFNPEDRTFLSSFSIQSYSAQEQRRLEIVKRLRAGEIRSQRAHSQGLTQRLPTYESGVRTSWAKAIHGFSSTISWIANDGSRWPSQNIVSTLLKKEKGEDAQEMKVKERGDSATFSSTGLPEGLNTADSGMFQNKGFGLVEDEDNDEMSTMSVFESDRDMDESNIFNLLYAPQTVRTQTQKRTQILLLSEIARLLRANFNSFFEELANEKEDVMSSVEQRNIRLKSILEELKQDEVLFTPYLMDTELKGAAVVLSDEELISRPYETEAVTLAKAKEEERKRIQAAHEAEDFKERALKEMMHGTLEVKRDVFADISLFQKPAWMEELSPSEMTEAQVKEVEDYENKLKVMQEDLLKYRKSLEQEMKKLKSETAEACKQFDEKVANATRIKVLVQREILTQELYIARLGSTMAKREQAWSTLKRTEAQIESLRKVRADLRVRAERFSQHVESVKVSLSAVQEEERALDKSFKRDFQTLCNNNFDQDSLKVFADLFRRREYAVSPDDDDEGSQDLDAEESDMLISGSQRASNRRSKNMSSKASKRNNNGGSKRQRGLSTSKKNTGLGGSRKGGVGASSRMMKASKGGNGRSTAGGKERLGPMQEAAQALKNAQQPEANDKDPFFIDLLQREKLLRVAESKIPLLMGLNIELDCPENFVVDQYTWSKLQDLRNIRIEKEILAKRMAIDYGDLRRKLDDLTGEESALVGVIGSLRQARDETLAYLESMETNLEVLVCLKQGQDEVDKDAVVTEYGEAVLVPTTVVDKYNVRIKELGREKVGVLSRIKKYRRKINLTEWNSQHLMMETQHMEEYFTDLQLLRVTRELQQVIRDGSNTDQTKDRLDKVAVRRDFLLKDSESKVARMRSGIDALKKQLADREAESSGLEHKLRDLRTEVAVRKNVKNATETMRGSAVDSAVDEVGQRMKKIVARRQLLDSARSQAEEADFLRQELDRMRQRTFPSFIKATKQRTVGADER